MNLNNPIDFARLTSSSLQGLLTAFGRDPREWDILEASYNGVLFHVFQSSAEWSGALPTVTDHGGRRKVKYRFPYIDGQALDDLGSMPNTFDLEVVIFGPKYKRGLSRLFEELNKPKPGVLIHPIRGKITCAMETFQIIHAHTARNAVEIRLTMIESTFTVGEFGTIKDDSTAKGAIARALDAFKKIDAAIAAVTATKLFVTSLKNQVKSMLEEYKVIFSSNLSSINASFGTSGAVDIPSLVPVNAGGTRRPDGTSYSTMTSVVSPAEAFNAVPVSEEVPLTVDAITAQQSVNALLGTLDEIIAEIEAGGDGEGATEFHDTIVDLKETGLMMQEVLEKSLASSRARILLYTTPRTMTIREVAFANALNVDRSDEIHLLNAWLLSVNFIESGTELKVPVS